MIKAVFECNKHFSNDEMSNVHSQILQLSGMSLSHLYNADFRWCKSLGFILLVWDPTVIAIIQTVNELRRTSYYQLDNTTEQSC